MVTQIKTQSLLDIIHELAPEHDNFIPMDVLRSRSHLSREAFDAELYDIQRHDLAELHSYCIATNVTPDRLKAGIPQIIGGPLFYVSVGDFFTAVI